jgi:hypothetical protein
MHGIPLASLAVLAIGAIPGWWTSKGHEEGTPAQGVRAGAIAGSGSLMGSMLGLVVLAIAHT